MSENDLEASFSSTQVKSNKQIQGTQFFLTFPQCKTKPKKILKRFLKKIPNVKWIVICQEDHKNTLGQHLHLLFKLNGRVRYSNPHYWDWIAKKHGDYSVVRNVLAAMRYTIKDNCFVHHGIDPLLFIEAACSKQSSSYLILAKLMQEGKTIDDLIDLHPGMVLRDLKKLQDFGQALQAKKARTEAITALTTWNPIDVLSLDQDFRILGRWMNNNLQVVRPFKQKQLWIWGTTNMGKTSLIMSLQKYFRTYIVPTDGKLDKYDDSLYDLVCFDEFRASHAKASFLNSFVEGSWYHVHRRYNNYLKKKNIPVIVLSNQSVESCYWKLRQNHPVIFTALKERFIHFNVTKFINLKI